MSKLTLDKQYQNVTTFNSKKHFLTTDLQKVSKTGIGGLFRRIERFFNPEKYKPHQVAANVLKLSTHSEYSLANLQRSSGYESLKTKFNFSLKRGSWCRTCSSSSLKASQVFHSTIGTPKSPAKSGAFADGTPGSTRKDYYNYFLDVAADAYGIDRVIASNFQGDFTLFRKDATRDQIRNYVFSTMDALSQSLEIISQHRVTTGPGSISRYAMIDICAKNFGFTRVNSRGYLEANRDSTFVKILRQKASQIHQANVRLANSIAYSAPRGSGYSGENRAENYRG